MGENEGTKAAVHGAIGLLAAVCTIYNLVAWIARKESHLARNAAFYGAVTVLEVGKTRDHLTCRHGD